MPRFHQIWLARIIVVALGMWAVVQVADPAQSGLGPHLMFWLMVCATGLGIVQGFLPKATDPSDSPPADARPDIPLGGPPAHG